MQMAVGWPKARAVLQRALGDKVEAAAALGLPLSVTPHSPTEDSRDSPVA